MPRLKKAVESTVDGETSMALPVGHNSRLTRAVTGMQPYRPSTARGKAMQSLKGSRTEENMRCALSGEVRSNRHYFSYARAAEAEGEQDLAAQLRATAESAAHQAFGHLDYLFADGDAAAGKSRENTPDGPMAAGNALIHERAAMYAGMARTAYEDRVRRHRRLVRNPCQDRTFAGSSSVACPGHGGA